MVINQWQILYVTIPAILLGNGALIYLARILERCLLVNYIGQHSLLYFVFGSHGMSVACKFVKMLVSVTGSLIFENNFIICPLICILGSLIMVVPCLLIDKFIPALNGRFKLPELNR